MENRLGRLEQLNRNRTGEMASLAGRTKVNEKDISTLKKTAEMAKKNLEKNEKKVEQLAEDVKNLKVKLEENKPPLMEPLCLILGASIYDNNISLHYHYPADHGRRLRGELMDVVLAGQPVSPC